MKQINNDNPSLLCSLLYVFCTLSLLTGPSLPRIIHINSRILVKFGNKQNVKQTISSLNNKQLGANKGQISNTVDNEALENMMLGQTYTKKTQELYIKPQQIEQMNSMLNNLEEEDDGPVEILFNAQKVNLNAQSKFGLNSEQEKYTELDESVLNFNKEHMEGIQKISKNNLGIDFQETEMLKPRETKVFLEQDQTYDMIVPEKNKVKIDLKNLNPQMIKQLMALKFLKIKQERAKQITAELVVHEKLITKINGDVQQQLGNLFVQMGLEKDRKKNCVFFQEMMKAMPSQEKTWTRRLNDFFTFTKVNSLKSYRTLAIEMLSGAEVSPNDRGRITELIQKYRVTKKVYYDEFMYGWAADRGAEVDQREKLRQEAEELRLALDEQTEQTEELADQFGESRTKLQTLSEQLAAGNFKKWQGEKLDFKKMIEEVESSLEDINFESFRSKFSQSSTVYGFITEFAEAHEQLVKWKQIQGVLEEHFVIKTSHEYNDLYHMQTVQQDRIFVQSKCKEFVKYLESKTEEKRNALLKYFRNYVQSLQEMVSKDQTFVEYSKLILSASRVKRQWNEAEEKTRLDRLSFEEINFRLQKTDMQDDFDYVFPSSLVIDLQQKKKELEMTVTGINGDLSFLDTGDTTCYLELNEQSQMNQFFGVESPDMQVTLQRADRQLELAMQIDQLEGDIDAELGFLIARAQRVTKDKQCFSLPHISYFIFTMIKTNVVVNEVRFFEGFFNNSSQRFSKEFVVFNYMLFTNEEFVDDLLTQYAEQDSRPSQIISHSIQNKEGPMEGNMLEDPLVKDYVSNYTLMMGFYRDTTEFSRSVNHGGQNSSHLAMRIVAQVMTIVSGKITQLQEDKIEGLVDLIMTAVTIAMPFILLIPFGKKIMKSLLTFVINALIKLMGTFLSSAASFFNRKYGQRVVEQQKKQLALDFQFDFEKEIKKVNLVGVKKVDASFDQKLDMKALEKKYLDILNDESNVFNKLENLSVFRDRDYDDHLIQIFKKGHM